MADEGEEVSYPFGRSCDLESLTSLLVNGWGLRGGDGLRHNWVGDVAHQTVFWGDVPQGALVLVDSEVGGCKVCLC